MNVKEAIERLKDFPEDFKVWAVNQDGVLDEVIAINKKMGATAIVVEVYCEERE